jgi:hypothetical protein
MVSMIKISTSSLGIFIISIVSITLSSCSTGTLRTPENIPRKAVISSKGGATLYEDSDFTKAKLNHKQWEVFFIVELGAKYIKVAKDLDNVSNEALYIKLQDAFEWNSNFCFGFKNSPDVAKRKVVEIYETESLKTIALQEKEKHRTNFTPDDAQPVLSTVDREKGIYKIATLYDRKDENGVYRFFGDHYFGYVKFDKEAYIQYRYIKKRDFESNVNSILAASNKVGGSDNSPNMISEVSKLIGTLISPDTTHKDGVKDLERTLGSKDIPDSVKKGIFKPGKLEGGNTGELNADLQKLYPKMVKFRDNPSNWNEGYAYIPVEWIK